MNFFNNDLEKDKVLKKNGLCLLWSETFEPGKNWKIERFDIRNQITAQSY